MRAAEFADKDQPPAKNLPQQLVPRHGRLPSISVINDLTISSTADRTVAGSTGHAATNWLKSSASGCASSCVTASRSEAVLQVRTLARQPRKRPSGFRWQ